MERGTEGLNEIGWKEFVKSMRRGNKEGRDGAGCEEVRDLFIL